MDFAPTYLIYRFFYRLIQFFHDWYVHGSRNAAHLFISLLERLDRVFAVKITALYFFRPLYGDYTVVGRVLGIMFRSFRIVIGLALYLFLAAVSVALYAIWIFILPSILFYVFTNF
ncbi:MAG: hypothetical protein Q7J22_00605 [Candidatus Wolfebacteria bacterium]|nr:hypothetical protein [Candidatus Wolfebacteria bacterium]